MKLTARLACIRSISSGSRTAAVVVTSHSTNSKIPRSIVNFRILQCLSSTTHALNTRRSNSLMTGPITSSAPRFKVQRSNCLRRSKCSQDGFTITLGVYSDENCYDYIGNGIDIASFGIDVGDDALRSYYNSAMGSTFEQLKYVEEPCASHAILKTSCGPIMMADGNIHELCVALYETSARCDKHYRVYSSKTNSAKYADAVAAEDLTCDFIDSVILSSYDEIGFVNLGTTYTVEKTSGFMADNLYAQKVNQMASEVTPLQVFGLISSLMAVAILGVGRDSAQLSQREARGDLVVDSGRRQVLQRTWIVKTLESSWDVPQVTPHTTCHELSAAPLSSPKKTPHAHHPLTP
ncbi:hypothetical protein ACHAXA_008937 [Cyclostephanos tholiformis]|uniref:Uncharacterized protein n=1 Tax=Cyclostephanos tholiformis TaxID=382380 RepID=A0ABD3RJW3_9STRA